MFVRSQQALGITLPFREGRHFLTTLSFVGASCSVALYPGNGTADRSHRNARLELK